VGGGYSQAAAAAQSAAAAGASPGSERVLEAGGELGPVLHLRGRSLERRADRLGTSAEAFGEEILGNRVEGDAVLRPREPMPFIREDDVGDGMPFSFIAFTICSDSATLTRGSLAP
jgi:hypothetical protein